MQWQLNMGKKKDDKDLEGKKLINNCVDRLYVVPLPYNINLSVYLKIK